MQNNASNPSFDPKTGEPENVVYDFDLFPSPPVGVGEIIEPEPIVSQLPKPTLDVSIEEVDTPQDEDVWTPQNPENVIVEDLNALDCSEDDPMGDGDEYGLNYVELGIEPPVVADCAGEIL